MEGSLAVAGIELRAADPARRDRLEEQWYEGVGGDRAAIGRWMDAALDEEAVARCYVAVDEDAGAVGQAAVGVFDVGALTDDARDRLAAYWERQAEASGDDGYEFDEAAVTVVDGLYVRPDWRRRGIGRGLLDACVTFGEGRHARVMSVEVWERKRGPDATPLVEDAGFSLVHRYEGGDRDRTYCPDCEGRCECPIRLYTRAL